jgi:glycosyltransferase involved in cell wall biosynthesis
VAARARGVRVEAVTWLGREIAPWSDGAAFFRLVRRLRQLRPDIVHTHSSKAGLLGRVAAFVAGVPVRVHTVHGWSFDQGMAGLGRAVVVALERLVLRCTDAVVVVTSVDRSRGLAAGIGNRSDYHVIRSAIRMADYVRATPEQRAATKRGWGIDPRSPVVGTVTRFAPPKDTDTLLDAFATLLETVPDARLVIAGGGPERAQVEARIDELGLGDHVLLLGWCDDVSRLLSGLDAFALASRREGLPRSVVEAVAAGLPVVATDVGGVFEVLRTAPSSRIVPIGDPQAMAAALKVLICDPAPDRPEARAAALAGFDEPDMVQAHARLYRALTSRG